MPFITVLNSLKIDGGGEEDLLSFSDEDDKQEATDFSSVVKVLGVIEEVSSTVRFSVEDGSLLRIEIRVSFGKLLYIKRGTK